MANDPLDFVRIEEAVARELASEFEAMLGDLVGQIEHKCTAGNYSAAYELINRFDLTGLVEKNRGQFEQHLVAAALFGANEVVPLHETYFATDQQIPQHVFNGVDQLVTMIELHVAEIIRDDLRAVVREEELQDKDELHSVSKQDLSRLYQRWNEISHPGTSLLRAYLDRREEIELRGDPFLLAVHSHKDRSPSPDQLHYLGIGYGGPPDHLGYDKDPRYALEDLAFKYGNHFPYHDPWVHGPAGLQNPSFTVPSVPTSAGMIEVGDSHSPTSLQIDNSTNHEVAWLQGMFELDVMKYDDSEARDDQGKWTKVEGLPEGKVIADRGLNEARARGAYRMIATPKKKNTYSSGESYTVEVRAEGGTAYKRNVYSDRQDYYDPKLAHLVTEDAGTDIEHQFAIPNDPSKESIVPLQGDDNMYRGINAEEFASIKDTGEVRSKGSYNIGDAQTGLTYWSTDPEQATSYANSFAPYAYKATFERPAYIIASKKPADVVRVKGTGEDEVGVPGAIKATDISAVWRGDVYSHSPGQIDLKGNEDSNELREGGSNAPGTGVVWTRLSDAEVHQAFADHFQKYDESEARDATGKWTEGQTATPEFKNWFGDSEVVDDQGKPMIMYHGTKTQFDEFDPKRVGSTDYGWAGAGFYFSSDPTVADSYGMVKMPAYLKAKKLFDFTGKNFHTEVKSRGGPVGFSKWLRENGYDGSRLWSQVMVLDPNQIKSADRNSGKFDPKENNITKDDLDRDDLATGGGLQESDQSAFPQLASLTPKRRKRFYREVKKALDEDSLYVHRPLLNGEDLQAWAKGQGFTSTLPPEDMHVTICYSKTPVKGVTPRTGEITVWGGGREVEQFGPAVVLHFTSSDLANRNFELQMLGASTDFPQYKSHVTISYDGAPDNCTQVQPYYGDLVFGPEVHAPLNSDWKSGLEEEILKAADSALADKLNEAALGTGKKLFDIGANLTTSRIIAFGFLSQAAQSGHTVYQINEILDDKTCPVCVFMHGKTFVVNHEYGKVLQTLGTSDPKELKSIAPWPDQSKAGLAALYGMTPEEMQTSGYGSPPYHPHCRGYLTLAGTVEETIPTGTLADQVANIVDNLQPEDAQVVGDGVVAEAAAQTEEKEPKIEPESEFPLAEDIPYENVAEMKINDIYDSLPADDIMSALDALKGTPDYQPALLAFIGADWPTLNEYFVEHGVNIDDFFTVKKYDPSEPRDEAGKWTDGGGEGNIASKLLTEAKTTETKTADELISDSGADTARKITDVEHALREGAVTSGLITEGGFKLPDGSYSPERQALHLEIIKKALNPETVAAASPKAGEDPTVTFLGGRGGSGKSWLTGADGPVDAKKAITINPDDIQDHLPGYEGWNAGLYHEEAAEIGQEIEKHARALRLNVVLDATMRTRPSLEKRIKLYKEAGYQAHGFYMFASPQTAARRAIGRFLGKSGRYVPVSYILGSNTNEATFDAARKDFAKWGVYSNNVDGAKPKEIAKGSTNGS